MIPYVRAITKHFSTTLTPFHNLKFSLEKKSSAILPTQYIPIFLRDLPRINEKKENGKSLLEYFKKKKMRNCADDF